MPPLPTPQCSMPKAVDSHIWSRYREIGKRLARMRIDQRYSQQQFAEALQISRTALAGYETGKRQIPFAVALAACHRLNLNIRWLVENREPAQPYLNLRDDLPELDAGELDQHGKTGDLVTVYESLLKSPLDKWAVSEASYEAMLDRLLPALPHILKEYSSEQLIKMIQDFAPKFSDSTDDRYRVRIAKIIYEAAHALKLQLEAKESWLDSRQSKIH